MERCVLCGKKFDKVESPHLRSHKVSARGYRRVASKLTAEEWRIYWKYPAMQQAFPDPTGKNKPVKGFTNFVRYIRTPGKAEQFA